MNLISFVHVIIIIIYDYEYYEQRQKLHPSSSFSLSLIIFLVVTHPSHLLLHLSKNIRRLKNYIKDELFLPSSCTHTHVFVYSECEKRAIFDRKLMVLLTKIALHRIKVKKICNNIIKISFFFLESDVLKLSPIIIIIVYHHQR